MHFPLRSGQLIYILTPALVVAKKYEAICMSILHHAGSAVEYPFSRDVSKLAQACIRLDVWCMVPAQFGNIMRIRVTWSNVLHDRFHFGLHVGRAH